MVYVPCGWYHQVHNLLPTVSINHNWFNGETVGWVWAFLQKERLAVREAIQNCVTVRADGLASRTFPATLGST